MTPTARPARAPGPLSPAYRIVTATLVSLVTIIAFESLAVSTIMPQAAAELNATTRYGLVFSSFITAELLGIVVAGTWIARAGPIGPTWAGQALFAAGSLASGLAPTFATLIAGRVVAGFGSGIVVVALYVVVGSAYPAAIRPRVFAWMSAAWVLPSIVGPLVAAGLAGWWSWRAVFLVVVPVVALTAAGLAVTRTRLARRPAAPDPASTSASTSGDGPAEIAPDEPEPTTYASPRATLWLGLAVAVSAGVFQWAGTDLVPPRPWIVAAAAAGLLGLALAARPLLPPGTGRLRTGLPAVVAARGAFAGAFNGAVTYVPLMLTATRGLAPATAGAILALSSLGWSFGAWLQGRPGFDPRRAPMVALGGGCVAAGLAGMAFVAATGAPVPVLVVAAAVLGVGMGLGTTAVSVLVLHLSPSAQHAQASSAMSLSDALGATVGLAVTGTLYASLAAGGPTPHAFAVLWAVCAAAGVVALVAGVRSRRPEKRGVRGDRGALTA